MIKLNVSEAVLLAHLIEVKGDVANTLSERRSANSLAKKGLVTVVRTKAAIRGGYVMEVRATERGKRRLLGCDNCSGIHPESCLFNCQG